jgi:diguanylate cyclase (GGDEF)-like protein/PAS domain S-box-containing protein
MSMLPPRPEDSPEKGRLGLACPRARAATPEPLTVGVATPLLSGTYFGGLLAAIAGEVAKAGGRVIAVQALDVARGGTRPEDAARDPMPGQAVVPTGCPPRLSWGKLDGIIALTDAATRSYLEAARAAGKPIVLVSCDVPDFSCPTVKPDNRSGIAEAVKHLVLHGRQRIAFVGNLDQEDIRERYSAYQDALRANGREVLPSLFFEASDNIGKGGRSAAAEILKAGIPCDAVVAATDYNAIALMDSLAEAGVRLPEDVAVIGFDNTEEAALCNPALSSVALPFSDVGKCAANLVLDLISGRHVAPETHLVAATLVVRSSCGCKPASSGDTPTNVDGIAQQLCRSLPDGDQSSPIAAQQFVSAIAAHLQTSSTDDELATLPKQVTSALQQLLLASPSMATALAVAQAARQASLLLETRAATAATKSVDRLLVQLLTECTNLVVYQDAITMSHSEHARDLFDISLELLREGSRARSLQWLSGTEALRACLGIWEPDATSGTRNLEVVGTFDKGGSKGKDDVLPYYPPESFPPAWLTAEKHDPACLVTYMMPLRTESRDWGVLAVLGPVWVRSAGPRDVYYEWSALLSMALDHEQTMLSLRQQSQNLAQLYERQSALASAMQKSGERYALALQATNEGLWDWEISTDQVYYSHRFLELLGFNASVGSSLGKVEDWVNAVHEEDRTALLDKLDELRKVGGEVSSFELEHRLVTGPGDVRWVLCKALASRDPDGVTTRVVGSLADITGRKGLEERLSYAALHDDLTGLPNRVLLTERIRQALDVNQRDRSRNFALLWLDLDRFKIVNDSMGHRAGDALLKEVAKRLKAEIRSTDTPGRTGGDEFVVLVNPLPEDPADLEKLTKRVQQQLAAPYMIDGHEVSISASVGVVTSTMRYSRTEDILRDADVAMYSAKQTERGSCAVFTAPMRKAVRGRVQAATDLRHALGRNELVLHYQPIVDLHNGHPIALESLVRWPRPDGTMVAPGEFLPTAREAGLMPLLGEFVLTEACTQQAAWKRAGILPSDTRVAVNISHEEFWHTGFLGNVDRAIADSGAGPLVLEITEGVVMDNIEAALTVLQELRYRGFQLYVDDFGTGRSSLEALRDLPVDALKIDRSFVAGLTATSKSAALVRAIVQMAQALGLTVIAEGIETEEEARLLAETGCPFGQGYLLSRPMPAAQASELLDAATARDVGSIA